MSAKNLHSVFMANKCDFYSRDSVICQSCPDKAECQKILDSVGDVSDILKRHDSIMKNATYKPIPIQKPVESSSEMRTVSSVEKTNEEIIATLSVPLQKIAIVLVKAGALRRKALDMTKMAGSTLMITQSIMKTLPASFESILKTVVREGKVEVANVKTVAVNTLAILKIFEAFEVVMLEGAIYKKKD